VRVLATHHRTVTDELRVVEHQGFSRLFLGEGLLADDSPEMYGRCAKMTLEALPLKGKSVAWIGGGLCVGPRLFAIADCHQIVYEIEPALAEFCPVGVEFIPGDYRETMRGNYDVIVYDLGGDTPRKFLERHLNPGGKILPEKD